MAAFNKTTNFSAVYTDGINNANGRSYSTAAATDRDSATDVDTEFLVIGCGPAGASLACFLTSYGMLGVLIAKSCRRPTNRCVMSGLKGIMIGAVPGTANTPRAHITNMAAVGEFSKKAT